MSVSISRARGELRDILAACRAVENRRMPPFDLDVGDARTKVSKYFSELYEFEDLRLDASVLNGLARVVQIQEARLRYEAGLFLADPELLAGKVVRMTQETLAAAFLASWHPVAQLEQVTHRALEIAKKYFDALPPWKDRLIEEPTGRPSAPAQLKEEEMVAMGLFKREGFLDFLGTMWEELKASDVVDYWEFIARGDSVRRAYGTAFLVSYGYAELEEHESGFKLRPNSDRVAREASRSVVMVVEGSA